MLRIVNKRKLHTPVVITTGFSTLENAVKALYQGAVGFIPKPFSVEEMTSIIKRGINYGEILINTKIRPNAMKVSITKR